MLWYNAPTKSNRGGKGYIFVLQCQVTVSHLGGSHQARKSNAGHVIVTAKSRDQSVYPCCATCMLTYPIALNTLLQSRSQIRGCCCPLLHPRTMLADWDPTSHFLPPHSAPASAQSPLNQLFLCHLWDSPSYSLYGFSY